MSVNLPNILYDIPRNVYTAIGVPVALGLLSGSQTRNVVNGTWYKVYNNASPVESALTAMNSRLPCPLVVRHARRSLLFGLRYTSVSASLIRVSRPF